MDREVARRLAVKLVLGMDADDRANVRASGARAWHDDIEALPEVAALPFLAQAGAIQAIRDRIEHLAVFEGELLGTARLARSGGEHGALLYSARHGGLVLRSRSWDLLDLHLPCEPTREGVGGALSILEGEGAVFDRAWRDGTDLVMTPGAPFPDRCAVCGETAAPTPYRGGAWRREIKWDAEEAVLLLTSVPIWWDVLGRDRGGVIGFRLCDRHLARSRGRRTRAWIVLVPGAALMAAGPSAMAVLPWGTFHGPGLAMFAVGLVLFVVGLIARSASRTPVGIAMEVEASDLLALGPSLMRLRGVSDRVLAELPAWPDAAGQGS